MIFAVMPLFMREKYDNMQARAVSCPILRDENARKIEMSNFQ
jgi:hypothetical protein